MSSPVLLPSPDREQRIAALDPTRSFAVQAPAGSGKTELLIQRFLRLLAIVEKPEAVVAITFTRKAAGEMMERIFNALRGQAEDPLTRDLAAAAEARDHELGWNLLEHPGRLRVQTIDSLCMSIAGQMPWLARLGAMPRIEENTRELYEEAARRTVLLIGEREYRQPLETLLRHLDNSAARLTELLAAMLAKREQWLELAVQMSEDGERAALEEAMARTVADEVAAMERLIPPDVRETWLCVQRSEGTGTPGMADVLLTQAGTWRKTKDQRAALIARLEPVPGLLEALQRLQDLPPPRFTDPQWAVMRALLESLKLAAAQLRRIFGERGTIDFSELTQAALEALGDLEQPSDLAFRLDPRIRHLLVDEFQDTSRAHYTLLAKLTLGWQPGDGRTLFLVGDPMQSIYRFRQAEVSLFLRVQRHGLHGLPVEPLRLTANYRSVRSIVSRVNALFPPMFPREEDESLGAVPYTPLDAMHRDAGDEAAVQVHGFGDGEDRREADCVVELVRQARDLGSVAILVRARSHLSEIIAALKRNGIEFHAREIDSLAERETVRDLLALTKAMLNRADRISWLAILRAPWCGLALADLEALVRGRTSLPVWDALQDLGALSDDGRERAARLRTVLAEAFAQQGRWSLRRWVERAWIRMGGPACLEGDESALLDARNFLDLLEAAQTGSDLADLEVFEERVKQLRAEPDPDAGDQVQIMTIHGAKGLEFDTVIVPGLGRGEPVDDPPLFLFHEWQTEEGAVERLLAPIQETGAEADPLYDYLQGIEKRKNRLERVRQLYVAATRAKKRLHLLGSAKLTKDGRPWAGTMLSDLWDALTDEERGRFGFPPLQTSAEVSPPALLRRLPEPWTPPEPPLPVQWEGAGALPAEIHDPTYEWVSDSLRHAGTVVHRLLQRSKDEAVAVPELPVLRKSLAHAGVVPSEMDDTARRVRQALERMNASPRSRWILGDHPDARSEYAISGVLDGEVVHGIVDRTFLDENAVRWIIDFKTSSHEGGGLEAFLDEQQRRYRDQLERYARLLARLGQPVRLGLYFPLLDGWREWAPPETA